MSLGNRLDELSVECRCLLVSSDNQTRLDPTTTKGEWHLKNLVSAAGLWCEVQCTAEPSMGDRDRQCLRRDDDPAHDRANQVPPGLKDLRNRRAQIGGAVECPPYVR